MVNHFIRCLVRTYQVSMIRFRGSDCSFELIILADDAAVSYCDGRDPVRQSPAMAAIRSVRVFGSSVFLIRSFISSSSIVIPDMALSIVELFPHLPGLPDRPFVSLTHGNGIHQTWFLETQYQHRKAPLSHLLLVP